MYSGAFFIGDSHLTSRYPFAVIKEKLHARRGQVIDFAMGARRLELPPELSTWLSSNPELALQTASPETVKDFKDAAIAMLQQEYGVTADHEQIVPIPGGRVAMTAIAACVLQPGDAVLVTEPGYPAFARLVAHWHANVYPVLLDPEQGFAPDLTSLTAQQLAALRIYSLNYPNNPSGGVLSPAARRIILDAAASSNAVIFNDNVYGPLSYRSQPSSLLAETSEAEVIELHALTKLYPIGPQGASFLTGSSDTMQKIATYSELAWAPMSALEIQATSWCFRDVAGRAQIKAFFETQLDALRETLLAIGFEPYPVPGGIYVLCKVPRSIAGKTLLSAGEAALMLMDEFDLAVVPFESPTHHYLRFTSMYRPEDLARLHGLAADLRLNHPT